MDIRNFFKDNNTTPPKSPPPPPPPPPKTPVVLELPDFLFISAAPPGAKRSRSTIAENIDDCEIPDGFEPGLHRVKAPLAVRIAQSEPKTSSTSPAVPQTTWQRKKRSKNSGTFFFSDNVDEQAQMFAAQKEKLVKQNNTENQQTRKDKLKQKLANHSDDEVTEITQEAIKQPPPKQPKAPPPSQTTENGSKPHKPHVPAPPPLATVHTTNTTNTTITKTTTTKLHIAHSMPNANSPSLNPPTKPPLKPPEKQTSNSEKKKAQTTGISKPSGNVPKVDDKELEAKIQEKMETVQKWQTKCSELQKQLAEATSQLTRSLDELDHLNSLYENSTG